MAHDSKIPEPMIRYSTAQKLLALPRSVAWFIGSMVATVLFGSVGLLITFALPYRRRFWFFSQWSFFLMWWAKITCGIRYTVEGFENIPETSGIVMSKHQSAWETLALQKWFKPQTWVLKKELMKIPFIGWALKLLAPIAIDRNARQAGQQMMEQGLERLRDGCWVVIFPEGTRVPAGYAGKYRKGGAVLAKDTGFPMVPVAHNAGEFWPRNSFLKFPGTIQVRIGKPIYPQGRDTDALMLEVKNWIEDNTRAVSQKYEAPSA